MQSGVRRIVPAPAGGAIVRRLYIDPVPDKILIARAVHGPAIAPMLSGPEQKRLIAAASDRMDAMPADAAVPLLHSFGDVLTALHATAGSPPMDGMLRAAIAGMLDGLDARTRFLPPTQAAGAAAEGGIGLKLTAGADGARVVRAYPHNPAAEGRGIPQTPQAGDPFDAPDAPGPDFERRQAVAALAMLSQGNASQP